MKLEINIDDNFVQSQLDVRTLSFTRSLDLLFAKSAQLRKAKQARFPTYALDNKLVGYNFAKKCGYRVPKILQMGKPLDEIVFLKNTVVKPMYESSGRGVFISYSADNIVYLNKRITYNSVSEAKNHAKNMLSEKLVKKDLWMVEELLLNEGELARDIKFYCFYGKSGLVLETEREPKVRRCWYDSDLNYVDTGKYTRNSFKGNRDGIEALKEIAEKLSLEVPSPFVRIDFLVCDNTYYIGEFTPLPGNYSGFNSAWDKKLGEYFIKATVDMAYDISLGKVFDNYLESEKTEAEVIKAFNK